MILDSMAMKIYLTEYIYAFVIRPEGKYDKDHLGCWVTACHRRLSGAHRIQTLDGQGYGRVGRACKKDSK